MPSTEETTHVVNAKATNTDTADAPEDLQDVLDLFEEPEDFCPPPPASTIRFFHLDKGKEVEKEEISPNDLEDCKIITLSLVGRHSLWAHRLWNAGMSMANYLNAHPFWVCGKRVLELGAAAGLPSLVACLKGAAYTVLTDYPDPELIENLKVNMRENVPSDRCEQVQVCGFQWGQDVSPLIESGKFNLILMADLIFNHTEHEHLLQSSKQLLAPGGVVFFTFTHHVVKWADRDLKFMTLAEEYGFRVECLGTEKWNCMFPEDEGDMNVRSTVHLYRLTC